MLYRVRFWASLCCQNIHQTYEVGCVMKISKCVSFQIMHYGKSVWGHNNIILCKELCQNKSLSINNQPCNQTWFDYISLLVIPCIIYYVTNKETLNFEPCNILCVKRNTSCCCFSCLAKAGGIFLSFSETKVEECFFQWDWVLFVCPSLYVCTGLTMALMQRPHTVVLNSLCISLTVLVV